MRLYCLLAFGFLACFLQPVMASTPGNPKAGEFRSNPSGRGNTLVTSVVLTENGTTISHAVLVRIYAHDSLVARLETRKGLLAVDLAGKVEPQEIIYVEIWKDYTGTQLWNERTAVQTTLANAQNLKITLKYRNVTIGSKYPRIKVEEDPRRWKKPE